MNKFQLILFIALASAQISAYADNSLASRFLKTQKAISTQIDILADSCWSIREQNPKDAIGIGQIAITLANEGKTSYRLAETYNYVGAIYLNYLHDIKNSLPYFEKALAQSLTENDSVEMGYAYNNLGDIYYKSNNLPLALKYDQQSYEIFQKINHLRGIGYSLTNLGEAYLSRKEYEQARHYFIQLNELEKQLNNVSGIAFSLLQIGQTYLLENKLEEATTYFEQAYGFTAKFENKTFKAKCLTSLANIYAAKNNDKRANELINEAIGLNIQSNYIPGIIENKLDLALLFAHTEQQLLGEKYIAEADKLARSLGFPAYILNAQQKKIDFYTRLKNVNSLIESYQNYFSIYDSLYQAQSIETLNEMQKSLHSQLTMEKMQTDLQARRVERIYMYIIILLLLFLGIILYWRFNTISKFNKKLTEINATKDKLFTIISHDLKAPFNSILGMCELINEDFQDENIVEAQQKALVIQKTANDTYVLITNLLNWSRTQLTEIKLHPEDINLHEFIEEILAIYSQSAQAKNIQLNNTIESLNLTIDKNSLNIVISNLICNALKFTGVGGVINISASNKNGEIYLCVSDNGVGIPKDKLSTLFNITENESTTGTKNEKGTGLGLVLCKQFVEYNKGRLLVESEPGKGSTFCVVLPEIPDI